MKGDSGRVGIVGGSAAYTGAPYFAARSAFAAGADLVFIYCDTPALLPLKILLPEAIVVDHEQGRRPTYEDLARLDVLLIGCGLGRENISSVTKIFNRVLRPEHSVVSLILDGDALPDPDRYRDYWAKILRRGASGSLILTPNIRECVRVTQAIEEYDKKCDSENSGKCSYVIAAKGEADEVKEVHGGEVAFAQKVADIGTSRRCGGLGDCLAGIIAAQVGRMNAFARRGSLISGADTAGGMVARGCKIMRAASRAAELERGGPLGLMPSDVISKISDVAQRFYEG